ATEENWKSYSKCVDALLRKKEIHNLEKTTQSNEAKINKEWEIITAKEKLNAQWDKISLCDQSKFNTQIDSLNQSYQTQTPQMPKFWSQVDLENLKNWEKILRKKAEEEEHKRKEKEISLKVEQRF
ncbi:36402_t:CDS:2, partial [Gigaspora margarita]